MRRRARPQAAIPLTHGRRRHALATDRVQSVHAPIGTSTSTAATGPFASRPTQSPAKNAQAGDATVTLRAVDRDPESGHRQRRAEHQRRIGHRGAGRDEHQRGGGEQRERPQRLVASAALRGERVDERAATREHRERRQARGELVDAEQRPSTPPTATSRAAACPRTARRSRTAASASRRSRASCARSRRSAIRSCPSADRRRACRARTRDDRDDEPREPRALARGQRNGHCGARAAGTDSAGAAIGRSRRAGVAGRGRAGAA